MWTKAQIARLALEKPRDIVKRKDFFRKVKLLIDFEIKCCFLLCLTVQSQYVIGIVWHITNIIFIPQFL